MYVSRIVYSPSLGWAKIPVTFGGIAIHYSALKELIPLRSFPSSFPSFLSVPCAAHFLYNRRVYYCN
ncbi:hypothetical protein XELAEV_18036624mg [Xenopus laevis]|uniref:Uncharacterized protein n=1 Tax=Xenopus laevis TaxID=8355 RepID=A0A974CAI5_XENLA|nr:hypothetical protein XELAEV_18036624mg [Xenopus laevis]